MLLDFYHIRIIIYISSRVFSRSFSFVRYANSYLTIRLRNFRTFFDSFVCRGFFCPVVNSPKFIHSFIPSSFIHSFQKLGLPEWFFKFFITSIFWRFVFKMLWKNPFPFINSINQSILQSNQISINPSINPSNQNQIKSNFNSLFIRIPLIWNEST